MKLPDLKRRKTRFPMARIKRIMQSDDDIGKVSTSAPVVLSKAIELFMRELVGECANNGKGKIGIGDLLFVINGNKKFEFLKTVIEKTE